MTAITKIRVQGLRSLRDVEFEPGRVTVLLGANGSGKSNLLTALQMAAVSVTGGLRVFVGRAGGADALLHYGSKTTEKLSLRFEFSDEHGIASAYTAELAHAADDSLVYVEECLEAPGLAPRSLGQGHLESRLPAAAREPQDELARATNWWLQRLSYFHFHDTSPRSALRTPANAEDDRYLRSDGSNLAAYLRALLESEGGDARAAWKRISMLVRRVAPFIAELAPATTHFESTHGASRPSRIRLDWIDERGERFGVHHLSDGTLRAIALITALAQPAAQLPAFISIDEPELGLHPAAIGLLVELVRAASVRSQIVLATQSPALLDHFAPEEVVIVERANGESQLRRLEPSELTDWLDDYRLSDLYDKNLLGGRP